MNRIKKIGTYKLCSRFFYQKDMIDLIFKYCYDETREILLTKIKYRAVLCSIVNK